MAFGVVKWFSVSKGYGFIQPDDGSHDIFVHITAVHSSSLESLEEGQAFEFELHQKGDGRTFAQALKMLKVDDEKNAD